MNFKHFIGISISSSLVVGSNLQGPHENIASVSGIGNRVVNIQSNTAPSGSMSRNVRFLSGIDNDFWNFQF